MVVLEQEILLESTVFHLHDKMYHQVLEYLMMIMHLLNIDLNHMLMLENDHHLSKYLTNKKTHLNRVLLIRLVLDYPSPKSLNIPEIS